LVKHLISSLRLCNFSVGDFACDTDNCLEHIHNGTILKDNIRTYMFEIVKFFMFNEIEICYWRVYIERMLNIMCPKGSIACSEFVENIFIAALASKV